MFLSLIHGRKQIFKLRYRSEWGANECAVGVAAQLSNLQQKKRFNLVYAVA